MSQFAAKLLADAGIKPLVADVPPDVEICERSGDGKRIWIIINHGHNAQTLHLPLHMKRVIAGNESAAGSAGNGGNSNRDTSGDSIQLSAHDVAIVDVGSAESSSR
jgi:hypothetical protein